MGTGGFFLRKVRAKVVDEPTGFVWVEDGRIAASGYPSSRRQVKWLADHGIRSILTLTPNALPGRWLDGLPLKVNHLPMDDHRVPNLDALDRGASFVQEQVRQGKPVLVHCLAGEGRTGCVLAAYLMKDRGVGAAEALEKIREAKPEFVEWGQEKALYDYASRNQTVS